MKRAKTITGLLWQNVTLRWNGFSGRGKTFLIVGLVLAGAVALHLGTCLLGGCPASASPCEAPCETPCDIDAAPDADDEPCPYAAAALEAAADEAVEGDEPPCHAR